MNAWAQDGLKAALDGSDKLLRTAQTLNMALGAGNVAILPDDVLILLRRMTHLIEQMEHTVATTKSLAMHRSGK